MTAGDMSDSSGDFQSRPEETLAAPARPLVLFLLA